MTTDGKNARFYANGVEISQSDYMSYLGTLSNLGSSMPSVGTSPTWSLVPGTSEPTPLPSYDVDID